MGKTKGTHSRTDRDACTFRVNHYRDDTGAPFIEVFQSTDCIPILRGAMLHFDLPDGTTDSKAEEIANYMTISLSGLAVTLLNSSHPSFNED